MTRRERLENKLERREQWAESRHADAERRSATASQMAKAIPLGQPMLVGHHSYKRDRNYRERIGRNFEKAHESEKMARHHESKAAGLEAQLDRSIFSDDENACVALKARIEERTAKRARMVLINKLYRKGDDQGLRQIGLSLQLLREKIASLPAPYCNGAPYESYTLSNLSGRIRADRERIKTIKARQALAEKAEATSSGVLIEHEESWHGWCRVTFAEKPDRAILSELKNAGYRWGAGHWGGYFEKLPEVVRELANA